MRCSETEAAELLGGVWDWRPFFRGVGIEEQLGHNVPDSYPTIDSWDPATGTATSIKSINLGASKYQSASALSRTLNEYIDTVADFNGARWGGLNVETSMIQTRALTVAIPDVTVNSGQWDAMADAYQYGLQQGVSVQYLIVPNNFVPDPAP